MCGGSDISYTYENTDIGLNIVSTKVYGDGKYLRTDIRDTLLRNPACCWGKSYYSRDLTAEDLDLTRLSEQNNRVIGLIGDREEFMKRRIQEEAEEREREQQRQGRGCTLL